MPHDHRLGILRVRDLGSDRDLGHRVADTPLGHQHVAPGDPRSSTGSNCSPRASRSAESSARSCSASAHSCASMATRPTLDRGGAGVGHASFQLLEHRPRRACRGRGRGSNCSSIASAMAITERTIASACLSPATCSRSCSQVCRISGARVVPRRTSDAYPLDHAVGDSRRSPARRARLARPVGMPWQPGRSDRPALWIDTVSRGSAPRHARAGRRRARTSRSARVRSAGPRSVEIASSPSA